MPDDRASEERPPPTASVALVLAFALAALSAVVGLQFWLSVGGASYLQRRAVLQFVLVAAAFAALSQAFNTSDFSLELTYEYANSAQPLIF